jgi:hypothetical protein
MHGVSDVTSDREPSAAGAAGDAPEDDYGWSVDALALSEERLELGAAGQPLAAREPARQTVSRLRPLARRRLRTFRPPFVIIRSRKPWVFFRRRWFG